MLKKVIMKGTVFLQPHSDDVVMSSFYHIKTGYFKKPYYVVTVFSESDWIDPVQKIFLSKKLKKFTQDIVTKIRLKEDRKFAQKMFMSFSSLGIPDSKLRYSKAIFDADYKINEIEYVGIEKQVFDLLDKLKPETLVFPEPEGLRQHLDHRIIYRIGLNSSVSNKYVTDDLPYSTVTNDYEEIHQIKVNNLLDKFEALNIYKSQINSYFFEDLIRLNKANGGYERIFKI